MTARPSELPAKHLAVAGKGTSAWRRTAGEEDRSDRVAEPSLAWSERRLGV